MAAPNEQFSLDEFLEIAMDPSVKQTLMLPVNNKSEAGPTKSRSSTYAKRSIMEAFGRLDVAGYGAIPFDELKHLFCSVLGNDKH